MFLAGITLDNGAAIATIGSVMFGAGVATTRYLARRRRKREEAQAKEAAERQQEEGLLRALDADIYGVTASRTTQGSPGLKREVEKIAENLVTFSETVERMQEAQVRLDSRVKILEGGH